MHKGLVGLYVILVGLLVSAAVGSSIVFGLGNGFYCWLYYRKKKKKKKKMTPVDYRLPNFLLDQWQNLVWIGVK
jgi:O-antigen/teichoic acid export membrane protein